MSKATNPLVGDELFAKLASDPNHKARIEQLVREWEPKLIEARQQWEDEFRAIEKAKRLTIKFPADIMHKCRRVLRIIGIDRDDLTGGEVLEALQTFIQRMEIEAPINAGPPKPPMTPDQELVFNLLLTLKEGGAMTGAEIIGALKLEKLIDQGTLTSRIIPFLKKHYGVKNQRGPGYYIDPNA